jgi:hypothetical protein
MFRGITLCAALLIPLCAAGKPPCDPERAEVSYVQPSGDINPLVAVLPTISTVVGKRCSPAHVIVQFRVSSDGRTSKGTILDHNAQPELVASSLKAVSLWRFPEGEERDVQVAFLLWYPATPKIPPVEEILIY